MPAQRAIYTIQSKTTKKGNTTWMLVNSKGKTVAQSVNKEDVEKPIRKLIRKMQAWPSSPKELETEADFAKAEKITSQRESWQSRNFAIAKWRGLLQTKEVAEYLGASEAWVRNNINYCEWHHSYKQKGDSGAAFFYNPDDVIEQLAEDEGKVKRLLRVSYKRYVELCTLVGEEARPEDLGWYKKVQEYMQENLKMRFQKEG